VNCRLAHHSGRVVRPLACVDEHRLLPWLQWGVYQTADACRLRHISRWQAVGTAQCVQEGALACSGTVHLSFQVTAHSLRQPRRAKQSTGCANSTNELSNNRRKSLNRRIRGPVHLRPPSNPTSDKTGAASKSGQAHRFSSVPAPPRPKTSASTSASTRRSSRRTFAAARQSDGRRGRRPTESESAPSFPTLYPHHPGAADSSPAPRVPVPSELPFSVSSGAPYPHFKRRVRLGSVGVGVRGNWPYRRAQILRHFHTTVKWDERMGPAVPGTVCPAELNAAPAELAIAQ
jgi:hypothetical protein